MKQISALLLFLCLCTISQAQLTILVPADQTTIQSALDAANPGTTILVAPGLYYENLVWPEDIDGIKLKSENGPAETIIDGGNNGRVLQIEGESFPINGPTITDITEIDGFTLQNGLTQASYGAGLNILYANPKLRNLIVQDNTITGDQGRGGGAYLRSFEGLIQDCSFLNNTVNTKSSANGAGLYIEVMGDTEIRDCVFKNNHGFTESHTYGGGLYLSVDLVSNITPNIKVVNCVIDNNSTSTANLSSNWSYGGGIYVSDFSGDLAFSMDSCIVSNNSTNMARWSFGGGIHVGTENTTISNSRFFDNSSANGQAIWLDTGFGSMGSVLISNSSFTDNKPLTGSSLYASAVAGGYDPINLTMNNCVIANNEGQSIGIEGALTLNHCTVAHNAKGMDIEGTTMNAYNSIFWKNGSDQFNEGSWLANNYNFSDCIIEGGFAGDNIITADPLFTSNQLFIPAPGSPCLGAARPGILNTDLLGNPRPMPANSYPDIGAYEIDQYFAHVLVKFFLDENEDGVKDIEEKYTSLGAVSVNDENQHFNFRPEGIYVIADQGPLDISYFGDYDPLWITTSDETHSYVVNTEDFEAVLELGLAPVEDISNLQLIITGNRFRCGEEIDFSLFIKNRGTITEEGLVWLALDNRLDEFSFATMPDKLDGNHHVGWNLSELGPSESMVIDFTVTAPLIDDADQIGEEYCFSSYMEELNRSAPPGYCTELRCSFDPNDKAVQPSREDNLALNTASQIYKIRFQNTGNDYARKVVITDTIDSGLDMSTFDLISSSHPYNLEVSIDDAAIKFEFDNIFLPDSITNEPGSHGYIIYSIDPSNEIPLNTSINNTAFIYFDFNPAIVTNTTESILVDKFPVSTINNFDDSKFTVYPNPSSTILYFENRVDLAIIYDVEGRLVLSESNTNQMSVKTLDEGIYILETKEDGNLNRTKIVVSR